MIHQNCVKKLDQVFPFVFILKCNIFKQTNIHIIGKAGESGIFLRIMSSCLLKLMAVEKK